MSRILSSLFFALAGLSVGAGLSACLPSATADAGGSGITVLLDGGEVDAGPGRDPPDAGVVPSPVDGGEAPATDAGGDRDAGPPALDAGFGADAGGPDAGAVTDAGPALPPPADLCPVGCPGDADVLLQAFYWDVPVDDAARNGLWWDHLASQIPHLRSLGIQGLWVPSPSKGNFGIFDMGYGIYDPYDLGAYEQKGTVETRFGSRSELEGFLGAAHARGIEVYADIVLNHVYTGDEDLEPNPAVTSYIAQGAEVGGALRAVYPTDEALWAVPTSPGARVEVEVGGYRLPWTAFDGERAYKLEVISGATFTEPDPGPTPLWHVEADEGATDVGPSGLFAIVESEADGDTFSLVASGNELRLRLRSMRIGDNGPESSSPGHGYRLVAASVDGVPTAPTVLTRTRVAAVAHTGPGEAAINWNWEHFHPGGPSDYLEGPGDDEVRPRWWVFGQDLNTHHPEVAASYQDWGAWLMNTVGFDGVRLDWVVGVQQDYVHDFLQALPAAPGGSRRFAVGEYFSSRKDRLREWLDVTDGSGDLGLKVFDFPLKFALTDLANQEGSVFDMRTLNTAGLVRDPVENVNADRVVTFVENHDTGKEQQYWLARDQDLAHAFVLFAPEQPCLFYKHVYAVPLIDHAHPQEQVLIPSSLPADISLLTAVRAWHLQGPLVVLSEVGDPFPADDAADVWIARRSGPEGKTGAAVVLNDHESETKGLWVDTAPAGTLTSWEGVELIDVTGRVSAPASVFADGRVFLSAPPRSFTIWMPISEWDPDVVVGFEGVSLEP